MTHPGEALRKNRVKLTLWIAAIEGLLMIVHAIPHLAVYILAVVSIAFWITAGRNYTSATGRQLAWIFAASQSLAVLVPIVWFVAKWVAIITIALLAVAALVFLFTERDHPAQQ